MKRLQTQQHSMGQRTSPMGAVLLLLLICGATSYRTCVAAVTVTPQQSLNFGTVSIPVNDASSIVIPRNGSNPQVSGSMVVISPGNRGIYFVEGLPADTIVDVMVSDVFLTRGASDLPEALEVTDYTNNELISNQAGEALLYLGATINTTNTGTPYHDAVYTASTPATLSLTYWSPDLQNFTTFNTPIDIEAAVTNTISLTEVQPLNFGTLFARTTLADQASLVLQANGNRSINNPGSSRIVEIAAATPAIVRVSGAAPQYTLTITPQVGSIELVRETPGIGIPRFVINNFVTLPDATGTTDTSGNLDIQVGATLTTEAVDTVYPSGRYTGTFSLTVDY